MKPSVFETRPSFTALSVAPGQEVRFLSRPLGLDFSRSIPMHVKAVKQETSNERWVALGGV